jgi:hypothetical protein
MGGGCYVEDIAHSTLAQGRTFCKGMVAEHCPDIFTSMGKKVVLYRSLLIYEQWVCGT